MPSAVALCKFVGTISLGLLTGVSYTLSTLSLPSLLTLPSARPAAYTLSQTTRLSALHIRALSTLSTLSLFLAFYLSPARARHPYLLWTGLVAATSGAVSLVMDREGRRWRASSTTAGVGGGEAEGFVEIEDVDASGNMSVNGEQVEKRARDLQRVEFVRMGLSAVGFAMGVVGIWGDGAA